LKGLAEFMGATYIDLHQHFTGRYGELRARLNNDHLHLLAGGYQIWQEDLLPIMKQFHP
jgi:lysophospholipase L1-like esterase